MKVVPWRRVAVLLVGVWFVLGALAQAFVVNRDLTRHDQSEYLAYARYVHATHGAGLGNRLQMPALPTLLSLVVTDSVTDAALFTRAKIACIVITAIVAAIVVGLIRRQLPAASATPLALIVAFYVFAFRGGYVQAEPLSYGALFVAFLAMLRAWRSDSTAMFAAVGALCGVAYLAKATALVGLAVFIACTMTRAVFARRPQNVARAALPAATFFATIFPYALNSKRHFGSWLHNVNNYVVWFDSFEDYRAADARVDFNARGQFLPPNEVPSAANYWHAHTIGQMVVREMRGVAEVLANTLISHGYAYFAIAYLTFFAVLLRRRPAFRHEVFARDARAAWWLVVPYCLAHLASCGWFGAITAGNRFVLGMFIPAMFALTTALTRAPRDDVAPFERWMLRAVVASLVTYYPIAMLTHYSGG